MRLSDWWYYTGTITKTLVIVGIAAMTALALIVASPHVAFLKPIAERLGLVTTVTQTIYVPVNHTVYVNRTIYVNQTVVRYINQTVPVYVYVNKTVYVPTSLNESLSAYLNDLFGWGGLRCWIVTFVYDNATPYFYVGNESTWGSMATIGTMVIPRQLLGEFYQWIQAGPNSTYYYPYGVLQILGFPETFIYAVNASNSLVELEGFSGELFEPNATNAPVVYLFGDWGQVGPLPHFYAAVINNTGGYMVATPPPWSVNATAVFYYNRTYTVLFFPTVMSGASIQGLATPFACNWTVIGPVDPSAIMSYPIPYAWTSSEIIAALEGNLTMSHVEHIYQRNNFGFWVWNMNVTTVNASLPYPTS